jgi:dUTP pyrophosphatase
MVKIGVKKLRDDAKLPAFSTTHAAGADIYLPSAVNLVHRYGVQHVPLGFALDIPEGYEVQIRAKSGLALKYGITLTNGIGTIDSDYKDEIGILLSSFRPDSTIVFPKGTKIAQLVVNKITPTQYMEVRELSDTDSNRNGGFGSTGDY